MASSINLYIVAMLVASEDDGGVEEFLVSSEEWLVHEVRSLWGKHRKNTEEDEKECWFVEKMVIEFIWILLVLLVLVAWIATTIGEGKKNV